MKLFCTTAIVALLAAGSPVYGQNSEEAADTPSTGLQDIIVTAQRRNENLQKASVAVSAISAETINATVSKGEDLTRLVPSATITSGGGGASVTTIRGIGTLASNGLAEQVVAYNLDGVYLSRPAASSGQFFDLERIEVLKGPQGTLYGRNATAGAINILTQKPTFKTSADLSGQIGNYDLFQAQGAINLPLSDKIALRVAGQGIHRDGYLSDGYNDQKQYSGRSTVLANVTDDLTVTLSGDFTHVGGRGSAGVLSPFIDPKNPYLGPSEPAANLPYTNFKIPGLVPNGLPPIKTDGFSSNEFFGVTGNVQYDADFGSITLLAAYRGARLDYRHYAAGFQVDNTEDSDTTSLEVRYATPEGGPLQLVVGGYYFKEEGDFSISPYVFGPAGTTPPFPSTTDATYETKAVAVFGEAKYSLSETVRLIGGLRYSDEKKNVLGGALGSFTGIRSPFSGDAGFNKVNFRAGIEADLTNKSFLYATVATGFKAGGFFAAAGQNSYLPETLTAYSIGSKNRFFDNKLQLNLELFYWKYKDKQVTHLEDGNLRVDNAGSATLYGAEIEASLLITEDDLFSLNMLYNHTNYDTYEFNLAKTAAWNCPRTTINATTDRVDCSGNDLLQAPLWTLNASYQHTFNFADASRLVFNAMGRYRSAYFTGDEQLVGMKQGAYFQGDLDLTYHATDDRWSVGVFGRNLTDKAVMSNAFVTSVLSRPVANLLPPRTYGLTFGVKF